MVKYSTSWNISYRILISFVHIHLENNIMLTLGLSSRIRTSCSYIIFMLETGTLWQLIIYTTETNEIGKFIYEYAA